MGVARGMAALAVAMAAVAASPVAAQDAAPAGESESWSAARAFVEIERLRAEIAVLRGLAGAQAALFAWNRERAESGAGPAVLPEALCGEREIEPWCRTLPATFGADAGRVAETHRTRHAGEGEGKP